MSTIKLKFYDPNELRRSIVGVPYISIRTAGGLHFSTGLTELLGVKKDDQVQIAQNDNAPKEWFIVLGVNGFKLNANKSSKGLYFSCRKLGNLLIRSLSLPTSKSYNITVAREPIDIEGKKCYPILTSSAK